MKTAQVFTAWKMILEGRRPFLSIELTRECPLRCPGCYAFGPHHAGDRDSPGRSSDLRADDLVERVLELVREFRPLHLSLVGGEPLVRYRELDVLLPRLAPLEVQLVTSGVRRIPPAWSSYPHVHIAVSVDGLPREHNRRRTPATYERILRNIAGHQVIIHCTITRQLLERQGYLRDFAAFWSSRPEARKIWFSIFTPQAGQISEERLTPANRQFALRELASLVPLFPKVHMPRRVLSGFAQPPGRPDECLFAAVTRCMAADLKTEIQPCEMGGNPECGECGCLASAGLAAVGRYRLAGLLPVRTVFHLSRGIAGLRRGLFSTTLASTQAARLVIRRRRTGPAVSNSTVR